MVPNLSLGSDVVDHQVFAGSPNARQRPFGPGHHDPYPGGYATPPQEAAASGAGFPLPFDVPAFASRVILFPLRS
jgi:hypothetical protein